MTEKLKKMHECKVTTLKNQYHGKFGPPKKGFYLFCQNISNLQYHDSDGYYQEVCNPGYRGGIAKTSEKTGIFDIATNPNPNDVKNVRSGFIAIIREKIMNDIETYRKLIEQMIKDGKISEKDIADAFVDSYTVVNQIKEKEGAGNRYSWKLTDGEIINYYNTEEEKHESKNSRKTNTSK